jgi:tRNA (guanine37-N1)-methyltransferase
MNEEDAKSVYKSFDITGDIAVIKVPDPLWDKRTLVAEAVMASNKCVQVVLGQTTPVSGDHRVRGLEWILGEKRTETVYRESGCIFKIDLAKAYFSPRLSHERFRIAKLVQPGEVVVNMFAGVGPFSIIIAKHSKASKIYNIDINPDAFPYAEENVKLNKVTDRVIPIMGDAREVIERDLTNVADRVLMPLPEKAAEYIDSAIRASKIGAPCLHYYEHIYAKDEDPVEAVKKKLSELLVKKKIEHELPFGRVVRAVGPRWYQIVIDALLRKN